MARIKQLIIVLVIVLNTTLTASGQEDPTVKTKKVSEWFKYIRNEPDARRRLAALALIDSEAGAKVGIMLPGLIRELREHPDVAIRAKIVELLPRYKDLGDDALNALKIAVVGDKEGRVREAAAVAIGRLDRAGFNGVTELGTALKDKHPGARAAAAEAIASFSQIDPEIAREAVPGLIECLKDSEAKVRLHSAFALGRMGVVAATAVPALIAALETEKDAALRKELIRTLAAMGDKASSATEVVVKSLHDSSADVRQAAAVALGRINPDPNRAVPELQKSARDSDRAVRCYAIHAVGTIGQGLAKSNPGLLKSLKVISDLIEILKNDVTADVRLAAIEELAGFGAEAKEAIDVLTISSKDGRAAIRDAALEALKKIRPTP